MANNIKAVVWKGGSRNRLAINTRLHSASSVPALVGVAVLGAIAALAAELAFLSLPVPFSPLAALTGVVPPDLSSAGGRREHGSEYEGVRSYSHRP